MASGQRFGRSSPLIDTIPALSTFLLSSFAVMRPTRSSILLLSSVTLLAVTGSPLNGQIDLDEEGPPRLYQIDPEAPAELVRAAFTAARLNRAAITREYLRKVIDARLSNEELLELRDDAGIDVILSLNAIQDAQPEARRLLQAINGASAGGGEEIDPAELIGQLGRGDEMSTMAANTLVRHGADVADDLLLADPATPGGREARRLLQKGRRAFRHGLLEALPNVDRNHQLEALQLLGRSADPRLAPFLLGYQFGSNDADIRSAAAGAVQRLWSPGVAPQNGDEAVAWLNQRAKRALKSAADRFRSTDSMRERQSARLAAVALQIEPDNPEAQAILIAGQAASDSPISDGDNRREALELALSTGFSAAVFRLLDDDPKHLRMALAMPGPRARLLAGIRLLGSPDVRFGKQLATRIVMAAASGSIRPEAVVIDPRASVGTRAANLLSDEGFEVAACLSGQQGFDAAVGQLSCELVFVHSNCLRWPLSQTVANLRADARTRQTPILIYGPSRDTGAMLSLQRRYPGVTIMSEPISEINFVNDLRRAELPVPILTESERVEMIRQATDALAKAQAEWEAGGRRL